MNGFLPLIEAFLAFALTMLALATAVSAIVGVWMRVFRWRAYGLRKSVERIYDKEIRPALSTATRRATSASDRLGFIADMTCGLNVDLDSGEGSVRERRLEELRAALQTPEFKGPLLQLFSSVLRRFRRWHSLRFGLDYLTEDQFELRLVASEAGQILASYHGEQAWGRLRAYLRQVFTEVGVTATEAFARRSRVRTVIAGLVLAIGVNIDAFDLLNTYMTDREIRRGVIAQQERILQQQTPDAADLASLESKAANYGRQAGAALEKIEASVAELAGNEALGAQAAQTLERLQGLLDGARSDVNALAGTADEVTGALSASRSIALELTDSFPIGWDGYPNCSAAALDGRCARVALQGGELPSAAGDFRETLVTVARVDTAGFLKWFLGVLLTAFMVGLGAPFWVETVNRILKLKDRAQNALSGESEEGTVPATPPASAGPGRRGGGEIARNAADQARAASAPPPVQQAGVARRGQRARDSADHRLSVHPTPGA